ncbi:quercetin dioxygenase-like cupin family protein [Hasllibacter halocynthiae]|uniref:Quercetin dioxygenase-like cupin family protein n=1 Tax=Hasllibacter halocynthiae TaxID=595589 RepID=A0A2T0X172_9RHOB|nr:cupin domain-containing protein [Hasllibacter halocynthiae]PRY92698.1 quercetin dioxygenase-like cupin family protein [Hasllibacter halocynthiae]
MTGAVVHIREADTRLDAWDDPARGRVNFRTLVDAEHGPSASIVQGIVEMRAGQVERRHHHDRPETGYVIEGEGFLLAGPDRVAIGAGDAVFVPAGLIHGWSAPDGPMRVLFTFAADRLSDVPYHWENA